MGDGATLGETLRRARELRGLTVPQVSATTKIPVRLLEALERDDFHAAPRGMYLRAEVLAYADAVGLDKTIAIDRLQAATDPPAAVAVAPLPAAVPRTRRLTRTVAAVAVGIAALTLGVLWQSGRERRVPSVTQAPVAPPAARTDVPVEVARAVSREAVPASATAGTTEPAANDTAPLPRDPATSTDAIPAPPRADAELEIVTEPEGAHVTIDGVGWGRTPVTIKYLPPGAKRLRITSDGFATEERVIRFAADQPRTTVQVTLRANE